MKISDHAIQRLDRPATRMAALILLIGMGTATCAPGSSVSRIQALVSFSSGKVTGDGIQLKAGDRIKTGTRLKVGPKSKCMLLVKHGGTNFTVSLLENSDFHLAAEKNAKSGATAFKGYMTEGKSLYVVNRIASGDETKLVSPTSIASVRGTKFSMNVRPDGTSRAVVYNGKISYRVRVPEVEDLPREVREQSKVVQKIVSTLEKEERVLESGESMTLDKQKAEKTMALMPEVKKALEKAAAEKQTVQGSEARAKITAASIDQYFEKPARKKILNESLQKIRNETRRTPAKIEKVPETEIKKSLQEYHIPVSDLSQKKDPEISSDPPPAKKMKAEKKGKRVARASGNLNAKMAAYEKLMAEVQAAKKQKAAEGKKPIQINRQEIMKKVTQITGRRAETIKLKGGRTLYGVIYQQGSRYIVLTASGKRIVRESQLAEIRF